MRVVVQRFMKVSGGDVHEKWAQFLDELTIAGHSHQTAAELYAEITDRMPLLYEVGYDLSCFMYRAHFCCFCCNWWRCGAVGRASDLRFIFNIILYYTTEAAHTQYTVSQKKLSRFVFVRTSSNFHKFR